MKLRIALVTPYAWGVPHPVNDHVAELAAGLTRLHGAGSAVIVAPSSQPRARRATRRALRDLASGTPIADVLAREDLAIAPGTGVRHVAGDVPVLTVGVAIGHASVASRAA